MVPPHNTSITCPECTHKSKDNRVTQSNFKCQACDYKNNADVVGAINILRLGHSRLACTEQLFNVVYIGDVSTQTQESPMVAA